MRDDPSRTRGASTQQDSASGGGGGRLPWSRALLLLAVAGPALWLGGVKPWVMPIFVLVIAGLLVRRCLRSESPLRVPTLWWLGLMISGVTLLQWLPLPPALLDALAPGLMNTVAELTAGTELERWNRLSVHPGQTGLELARVLALTGLFVATAQLSWRLVAAYVSLTGTLVALIGLGHKLAGATAIYGVYVPRQQVGALGQELGSPLLTSFVNPNHQSGLLLLGMFAAASMAVDLTDRARETRGRANSQRLADRAYMAWGALAIQATALVLSMSRAALLAVLIVAPLALALGLRKPKVVGSEPEHARRRTLGLVAVVVTMLTLAATQGAWGQLATLRNPDSFHAKLRVAIEGAELLRLSPVLGIGRGCFVDLFPLVDSEPGPIVFTHLESTPIAFVVEWGPAGLVLLIGIGVWWWRSFRASQSLSRRLGLCGLLALGIQSGADFSLDYLGVAAPAAALAGALGASKAGRSWSSRPVIAATIAGLLVAESVALIAMPHSWSLRRARDRALLAGEGSTADALASTPLDPFVHLARAREHAASGDWQAARQRAEVAARLRPASIDAHLIAAVAAAEVGAPLGELEHLQRGLEALREPVPEALLTWLLARFPAPEQLGQIAPSGDAAWAALAHAVADESPTHARALASARTRTHPEDPEPLRIQTELALASKNYGLALHHARLLAQLAPNRAMAHRLRAEARFALGTPAQLEAAVAELEVARENTRLDDPALVDELLINALLRVGDARSLDRAEQLLDGLLARRAKPDVRRRRDALAERVRQRKGQ
ncbi:MAG TPA: O-antigen ligase family protein [Enhygromyxa sp.]|nr:O-antigen ligase family protein [Enhygromyxa sp.]